MVGTEATIDDYAGKFWRTMRHIAGTGARRLLTTLIPLLVLPLCSPVANAQATAPRGPVRASGNTVYRWQIGQAQATLLETECTLQHQGRSIEADSILLVADGPPGNVRTRIVVAGMRLADGRQRVEPTSITLISDEEPTIQAPRYRPAPKTPPALLQYLPADASTDAGSTAEATTVQPVQFLQPTPPPVFSTAQGENLTEIPPPPTTFSDGATTGGNMFYVGGGTRSVEFQQRSASMPIETTTINRPEVGESVVVARGGVTVLVRDVSAQLSSGRVLQLGTISLSADRIVAWLPTLSDLFTGNTDYSQADGELYLEGDIVFRQGERIIYAERMYYNVAQQRGVVLDAEAITTIPDYLGIVRLKADVLQQIASGNFIAFDAALTTSRMGVPRYWLQSQQLTLTDRVRTVTDPRTGQPRLDSEPFASSSNNFVYVGGFPVLYWPRFSTSLERPTYYINGIKLLNDNTFGAGIALDWNLFQLFGIQSAPKGVDWELSTDYLGSRGPAVGTTLEYNLPGLFGLQGPVNGFLDAYYIRDRGNDRLGNGRLDVPPETKNRGRALLRHRHNLPRGFELIAQVGWISDRNFLEEYLEIEWDQQVDHTTGLWLRKYYYNNLFQVSANAQVNDFFTVSESLPSLEHYLLGGSLLGDRLTWTAYNRATYAKLNVGSTPTDPTEAAQQSPIPGNSNRKGEIISTRQELAMPVQTGPFKFVPFISGEAARYGEDVNGNPLTRLLGQAGVRASLPMSRVDPTIQSSLMNVRRLAHKVEFTAEYFYADSDQNLDSLPLYDQVDDIAQTQFRKRFIQDTYGGTLPLRFDPRNYAFRGGIQSWVTSPSATIADDLQQFSVGVHQRFQTKRGLPGRERIVDLLQFDVDMLLFPDAARDNFGETLGPTTYDMQYHIGDRFSIMSDGYFDFFPEGLKSISAGVQTSRPGKGNWYVGLLSLEGPISSTVVRSVVDYRMNEKWILSAGSTYDFGPTGNVGQAYGLTRIGESLLVRMGFNVDHGRDNVGVGFSVEPRFWPSKRLGRIGGTLIPPPGVEGLE